MQLRELLEHLESELANRNLGWGNGEEGLNPIALKRILPVINLALISLYTRFPIRTNWVKVRLYDDYTIYKLHKNFAQSNTESQEPIKFIEDNPPVRPFYDRVLKIDQVLTGDGCQVAINDERNCNSVFTPYADTIQVPCPVGADLINVLYRAAPPKISNPCDLDMEIDLPHAYLNALIYFVISKIIGSRDKLEAQQEGQLYFSYYERECQNIENNGMAQKDNMTNMKLEQRGFI